MKYDPQIILLIVAFIGAGAAANFFARRILQRVSTIGAPTPKFHSLLSLMRQFRVYQEAAPKYGWPLWHVYAFWILLTGGLILMIALARAAEI